MSSPQGIVGICFKNSLSLPSNKVRRIRLGSNSRGQSLNTLTFSAIRSLASLIEAADLSSMSYEIILYRHNQSLKVINS